MRGGVKHLPLQKVLNETIGIETITDGTILEFCIKNKNSKKMGFINIQYFPSDCPIQVECFVIIHRDDNANRLLVRLIPYDANIVYEYRRSIFNDVYREDGWKKHEPYSEWNKPNASDVGAFPNVSTINSNVNLDDLLMAGVYDLEYAEGYKDDFNLPTNAITHISLIILGTPTRLTQIATLPFSHEWAMYIRYKHDSTWSSWKKIETV